MASASLINSYLPTPDVYLYNAGYVYPNPAQDYITIEYRTADVSDGKLWLLITDVSGRKLREIALKGGDYDELIDISSLIPGVYTVSIQNERVILSTQKLTVKK